MKIEATNLGYKYDGDEKDTLNDLSFIINEGEWVSIIGHNGSGKSTLAKLLIGILTPTRGQIICDGVLMEEENLYDIRKHIGIIYQNPDNQFVATSVEDDIAFGLENLEIPQNEMESIVIKSLEKVSMLDYRTSEPSSLSGGQKQRVAIAGIIAMNTDVVIFDEATSMLDPNGKTDVINIIKELKKEGKTIIMITHDMNEAMLSDRCLVMCDGDIIKDDKPINVMLDLNTLKKTRLEMPSELALYHKLKENNYKDEEVLEKIWELAFKM